MRRSVSARGPHPRLPPEGEGAGRDGAARVLFLESGFSPPGAGGLGGLAQHQGAAFVGAGSNRRPQRQHSKVLKQKLHAGRRR